MIVSMFSVQVPPEAAAGFEQSWSRRAGLVDSMPGFQSLDVLRDPEQPGAYVVMTRWQSKGDFDNWVASPAFMAGRAHSSPSAAQGTTLRWYEVLDTSQA